LRKTALIAAATVLVVGLAMTGAAASAPRATTIAALVSDIGKFTDRGFNQNQLSGLNKAKTNLGVTILAKQSNSTSDYIPNLTAAVRAHANIVISAGFLLADATATMAKNFPSTHFAITDYSVHAAPFADKKGNVLYKNVEGLTYAANESGCLVGVLAAKMAQKMGKKVIGAVGGLTIPPVTIWIAGYKYCAQKAVPGTKVLIGYSQSFTETDKCGTVAQNQIGQGAQVLFQVAGGCGLGTLKAADAANIWGIGVDVDQYKDAKNILTSALKQTGTSRTRMLTSTSRRGSGTFPRTASGGVSCSTSRSPRTSPCTTTPRRRMPAGDGCRRAGWPRRPRG